MVALEPMRSLHVAFPSLLALVGLLSPSVACNGAKPREGRDPVVELGVSAAASSGSATAASTSPDASASAPTADESSGAASSARLASDSSVKAPNPKPDPSEDRIYAKARHVWILPAPQQSKGWLGYLTIGGSVRLYEGSAAKAKAIGPGCDAYYRVDPMGYVCAGEEATLDPNDPSYRALLADAADVSSAYPYGYAESLGAPRFEKVPTDAQQRKAEWDFDKHQEKLAELRAATSAGDFSKVDKVYLGVDVTPAGTTQSDLFPFGGLVREGRDYVAPGSTVAFSRAFDEAGRTWLVTSDHAIVPKDRTRPYPKTSFAGIHLGSGVELPIAFARRHDAIVYQSTSDGVFEPTAEKLPRLGWVMLSAKSKAASGTHYVETKQGTWLDERDLAIADLSKEIPYRDSQKIEGRHTWVDISVLGGTLVAYEGATPVFATLVSPGRGGIPFPGHDPLSTASTPTGTFRVDGKFKTATMVSSTDSSIVHSEVQFVQNFHGPHALHGAYWHDAWGELKSGGCVNLSPTDSKFMFEWTDPQIPRDWYGLRSVPELGAPTRVVVRR